MDAEHQVPAISVLVCSKNQRTLLVKCLESLATQTYPRERFEVVVVEEAPGALPPPDAKALAGVTVEYVRLTAHRRGFGHPRNVAVEHARCDLVAFLDDDCEARDDWLRALAAAFESRACEGVGGAVLARAPGVLGMCELALGFPGGGVRYYAESHGQNRPAATLSTCNALLRKQAVLDAGGFDDGMLFGGEDTLLAGRICRGERRFIYAPGAVVYHKPRGSWRGIARWFLRRGRAQVDVALRSSRMGTLILNLLLTSVFVRLGLLVAVPLLLGLPVLIPVALAAWYLILVMKYRRPVSYFGGARGIAALLVVPLVRWWMDVWFELGVLSRLPAVGKRKRALGQRSTS